MATDVVIIGGSLAGAACVRELTRLGVDAVAFEREVFPRPKVCGGFVSANAVDCLDRLGLLPAVREAGACTVDHAKIHSAGGELHIPFPRAGLGISRSALDHVVALGTAVQQGTGVQSVRSDADGFTVDTNRSRVRAKVIVDAAGKLSRFSRRLAVAEFGVQYFAEGTRGSALDFWFFHDGYGGAVTVEQARSNFCFLLSKEAIGRYPPRRDRLVTGPLAYEPVSPGSIRIGDAAGMIDPFCGEGIHHALDSGITAAHVIAGGLRNRRSHAEIAQAFNWQWQRRWSRKRLLLAIMRKAVRYPLAVRLALGFRADWFLRRLWATID
jgi:menaquinone-9 beta-reductase